MFESEKNREDWRRRGQQDQKTMLVEEVNETPLLFYNKEKENAT